MTNRPEDEKFTKEISGSVNEDLAIEAEAHCNLQVRPVSRFSSPERFAAFWG